MQTMTASHTAEQQIDNDRWRAVQDRDTAHDGAFVYGVTSTGVFCRPSCPSRRPRRERVAFFDTPAAARGAGFRPCQRCRPDVAVALDPWIDKVRRATVYLANVDGHPSLSTLAARIGGSPYHLQRNFKRIVGVTPREYAEACRLQSVKRRLREGIGVTGALFDAGYGSSSRFYERAAPKLGMPPASYRRGGVGVDVSYAIVDSPLGRLLIAATNRGVCSVMMGSSDRALVAAIRREYPAARVQPDAGKLAEWTNTLVAHLEGRMPRIDLPLDIRATAFQWQVWQALTAIPHGETRTYSDVARTIGKPTAVRAVARACATNPVAVAIPCHRVVPVAGGTGGYRWGSSRKKLLLDKERRS